MQLKLSTLLAALALTPFAAAQNRQPIFSIDWRSPTVGQPDSGFALPITEGDLLFAPAPTRMPQFGPAANPAVFAKAGPHPMLNPPHIGLVQHGVCMGHPGGTPCAVEVDAICTGRALLLQQNVPIRHLYLSVDAWAGGFMAPVPPSIASEAPLGESAGDVFVSLMLGAGPLPPFAVPLPGATAAIDGDGQQGASAFRYRGLGLAEPTMPTPGMLSSGDNLDALASWLPLAQGWPASGVFFSLDGVLFDPLSGTPGTNSSGAHGFVGGDVLVTVVPNTPPLLYAPANQLGLDFFGANTDDLDALVICENNLAGWQRSIAPYGWVNGQDMLLFSVRRGSAVIGRPDSIFGIPISEGDVLVPPVPGGLSPFPGIFIAAENLGLATVRQGLANRNDELDALELPSSPFFDCDGNGNEDALDIRTGGMADANNDGIPDVCSPPALYGKFCFCPAPMGPCGNDDPNAGCKNSTGVGAQLTPSGSTSVAADDLVLTATALPTNKQLILMMSAGVVAPLPFSDGRRCLVGLISRFPPKNSGAGGTAAYGPGLAAYSVGAFPVLNHIVPGALFGFQAWYRDPTGPCGSGSNLTNAVRATFVP
jgi:hypothetical protein